MTMVPQYSPVQPTGRSHPATRVRPASAAKVRPARGRVVGIAPKISPRCLAAPGRNARLWRLGRLVKVGGGAFVTPRLHDRLDYLIPRHASSQFRGKRGYRPCDLWLAAYGCDDLLRAVEQNGPMLQECVSFPDLRRAHQLATGDEYLAAYRGREARRRLVDPRGWWRLVGGQRGIGTEGPEGCSDAFVDGVVRVT